MAASTISVNDLKDRLMHPERHMPDQDNNVYRFSRLLYKELEKYSADGTLTPSVFVDATENLIDRLARTNLHDPSVPRNEKVLLGYPFSFYMDLRKKSVDIAQAYCPEEFADAAKNWYEELDAEPE